MKCQAILKSGSRKGKKCEMKSKIELNGEFKNPPKEITPEIEELFQSIQSCGKDLDINLEWKDSGGAADGNRLAAAGLPNIDSLGVLGNHIHSSNEYAILDSLVHRSQLTALFLMKLASGDIKLSFLK